MGPVQSGRRWIKVKDPWGLTGRFKRLKLDGHVSNFLTVHFQTSGLSTLVFIDRPLLSFESLGPSTLSRKTVHYRPGTSTLAQMTVQFG